MENLNNNVFGFGSENNEELEQTNRFDYSSISGLGESDYENEDLFSYDVDSTENENFQEDTSSSEFDYRIGGYYDTDTSFNDKNLNYYDISQNSLMEEENMNGYDSINEQSDYNINQEEVSNVFNPEFEQPNISSVDDENNSFINEFNQSEEENINVYDSINEQSDYNINQEEVSNVFNPEFEQPNIVTLTDEDSNEFVNVLEQTEEQINDDNIEEKTNDSISEIEETYSEEISENNSEESSVDISDTPIEELNRLTEYKEDKFEETDINALFDRVSVNVKDASDIFRKNTDLKQKIDSRFEELKKLQSELENSRKKQIDEINNYKEEVLSKLTDKKEEIEKRLNLLKETKVTFEKEKQEFEQYKKKEQDNIDKVQKEVQSAYDDRREELSRIEDVLRRQKDSLDEERSQLSLDKIQYESDKNELANNLLKFNELVNSFTNGMSNIKE